MRADDLIDTLTEIRRRWLYHIIYSNVDSRGSRRREDVPWSALVVMGDLGSDQGHECVVYEREEGCVADGHDDYQFVAWIDSMGDAHYIEAER
jgi:hypothetical protein